MTWFAVALLHGCGSTEGAPGRIELAVFAASSLTESFQEIERAFEAAHPDVDVGLTFSGSQVLKLQIEQGAPADVFASAHEEHLATLVEGGLVAAGHTFAHNELVVIVPAANPAGLARFEDLPRATRLVIGTENVPVGLYTRQMLDRAGQQLGPGFVAQVRAHVVSEESNVRLARAKVELGEADAAIVYRTDAAASDRVRVIPIPEAYSVQAAYVIGTVTRSSQREQAGSFVAFVRSEVGQRLLERHGFSTEAQ